MANVNSKRYRIVLDKNYHGIKLTKLIGYTGGFDLRVNGDKVATLFYQEGKWRWVMLPNKFHIPERVKTYNMIYDDRELALDDCKKYVNMWLKINH